MDLPLPDPEAPTAEVRWTLDAGVLLPSAMAAEQGDIELLAGPCASGDSMGFDLGGSVAIVDRLEIGVRATVPIVSFGYVSAVGNPDTRVYDAM